MKARDCFLISWLADL